MVKFDVPDTDRLDPKTASNAGREKSGREKSMTSRANSKTTQPELSKSSVNALVSDLRALSQAGAASRHASVTKSRAGSAVPVDNRTGERAYFSEPEKLAPSPILPAIKSAFTAACTMADSVRPAPWAKPVRRTTRRLLLWSSSIDICIFHLCSLALARALPLALIHSPPSEMHILFLSHHPHRSSRRSCT